jgi:hypothetical protein
MPQYVVRTTRVLCQMASLDCGSILRECLQALGVYGLALPYECGGNGAGTTHDGRDKFGFVNRPQVVPNIAVLCGRDKGTPSTLPQLVNGRFHCIIVRPGQPVDARQMMTIAHGE